MLDFLLEHSGVARSLEPPVTLEEILGNYCTTPEKFSYVISLLERLPEFANEKLKLSNCIIRGELPYDSLIELTKEDLDELQKVMDYLDLPSELVEKLEPVAENLTAHQKYVISFTKSSELFDSTNTSHWSYIGDLDGLKYAHAPPVGEGCPWDVLTWAYAAYNGHLECLKYAHEQGCPWDEKTCAYAAYNGHLECLKYAHTQGCPWDVLTCAYAAYNGHLDCLKYAHAPPVGEGCPWNESTCTYAAGNGQLECLRYAHTQGCPWNALTLRQAKENGHLECFEYASNPPIGDKCPSRSCAFINRDGHPLSIKR